MTNCQSPAECRSSSFPHSGALPLPLISGITPNKRISALLNWHGDDDEDVKDGCHLFQGFQPVTCSHICGTLLFSFFHFKSDHDFFLFLKMRTNKS